jgi:hypothetical protein
MPRLRIAASLFVTFSLIALCLALVPSAFALAGLTPDGNIGAGALPQFVVVAVPLLSLAILVSDLVSYRKGRLDQVAAREGEADVTDADPRRVLVIGSLVLVLLAAYAAAWRLVGFPLASLAFMATMAFILAPQESRNLRGTIILAATTLVFCLGTWALFVHVLMVPLR